MSARAVRFQQPEHGAWLDAQAQLPHRHFAAIGLGNAIGIDHRHAVCAPGVDSGPSLAEGLPVLDHP